MDWMGVGLCAVPYQPYVHIWQSADAHVSDSVSLISRRNGIALRACEQVDSKVTLGTNDAKMGVGSFQTEDGSTTSISISNWGSGVEFANQIMKPRTSQLGNPTQWEAECRLVSRLSHLCVRSFPVPVPTLPFFPRDKSSREQRARTRDK
ncbi:Uncharacterized protein HZ326_15179 [Fusarium oxysporum f. sp. albedinis]|nr:Uncharacterized protein HZ326_15179 [Fusarium oxysporum f. sp. albedinis]